MKIVWGRKTKIAIIAAALIAAASAFLPAPVATVVVNGIVELATSLNTMNVEPSTSSVKGQ